MTLDLRLHEDAVRELDDAADYYDRESPGLGSTFVNEVEAGFARIVQNPRIAPASGRAHHRLVLRRFPYSLIYEIRSDHVLLLAIAHQRKRPFYWRGRS